MTLDSTGTYFVADLAAADGELKDLEEDDEIALAQIESTFGKSSTRSRQRKALTETQVDADAVSSFVAAKREWVVVEEEVGLQTEIPLRILFLTD